MDEVGKMLAEVTTQTSETYHDNAWFDEAVRLMGVLNARTKEINNVLNGSKIVQYNKDIKTVHVWSVVTIEQNGHKKEIQVWWAITIAWRVSYLSPLGETLMGKTIWDETSIIINKKIHKIKVLRLCSCEE